MIQKTVLSSILALSIFLGCASLDRYTNVAESHLTNIVKIRVAVEQEQLVNNQIQLIPMEVLGAGVFVTKYGHILTAAHLFPEGHKAIKVETFREPVAEYGGTVIKLDRAHDLALIKISYYKPGYAKLAPINSLRIGEEIVAIGHPLGLQWSVAHGIISSLDRGCMFTQNDAAINQGNSGGPLFDMQGRLIGINSHLYTPSWFPVSSGLSMATSIESIHEFFFDFKGLEEVY